MNNRTRKLYTCIAFAASFIILSAMAPSGVPIYDLSWHTIDGGGGTSTDGTFEVSAIAGQPDPIILTGSGYVLTGGFWSAFEAQPCPADITDDGLINVSDLLALLAAWGACGPPCPPDINSDGNVNVTDLLTLLAAWGACP